jgi:uncharacterized protein DUF1524
MRVRRAAARARRRPRLGFRRRGRQPRYHQTGGPPWLNLLAADGPLNMAKGDGDAATWLPPNTGYRCAYVACQVAVKVSYDLWMTQAERNAIATVLSSCPDEPLPGGVVAELPERQLTPAPAPPRYRPPPGSCTGSGPRPGSGASGERLLRELLRREGRRRCPRPRRWPWLRQPFRPERRRRRLPSPDVPR